jgi:PAS domain S-box-containing protein
MFLKYLPGQVSNLSEKVPLRILLVVPFVLQIFAVVGFIGWLSLRNGQKAVHDVTNRLHSEITDRLEQYLNSYLKVPLIANQLNADAITLGLLNVQNLPALERHFWNQLQTFESLGYLALGNTKGQYIEVLRQNDGQLLVKFKDATTGTARHTYALSSEGKRTKFLRSDRDYDPRVRPFYQTAVAAGAPIWTEVYLEFNTNELSSDAVRPVSDRAGMLKGVLDAGSSLSQVSEFLQGLKIGRTGQTFIIERSGMLIASSTSEKPFFIANGTTSRFKASQSRNILTRSTAKYLTKHFGDFTEINHSHQLTFDIEGQRQFLRVTPLRKTNSEKADPLMLPDWLIVVVVPEADFQESINANTRSTILLCLAAMALATLLGILTYHWITQPILRLAVAATEFARGEWNQVVPVERSDELGVLARAFSQMALQLQESFATLSQRQESLAEAQKIAHVGNWELDLTAQTITGSDEFFRIFGREPSVVSYTEYLKQIHPEDADVSTQIISQAIAQGKPYEFDCQIKRPDGSSRYISTKGQPTRDNKGRVLGYFGTIADITERKLAEQALEQAKSELEIRVEERTAELRHALEQLQQSEVQLKEQALQLTQALYELQQAQTQLVHTEKMSSLGQLVAGVAHEINNPVSFIYGNLAHAQNYAADIFRLLHLYQKDYPSPSTTIQQELEKIDLDFLIEDFPRLIGSMQVGADRIREIVQSLRNFSRYDEAEMKDVNIHEGIDSTLMILQSKLSDTAGYCDIKVIKEYGDLPLIECYVGQMNQVFMNILSNAIDALEKKRVRIKERRVRRQQEEDESPPSITICTSIQEHRVQEHCPHFSPLIPYLLIQIADNGCGMSESVRSRIFDPFFTTKPIGSGTGLGLSISYQIVVERHKGALQVTSAEERGTEFAIALPLRQNPL